MDISRLINAVKYFALVLFVAVLLLFSLHSLGLGWRESVLLSLLPLVFGLLHILVRQTFLVSGIVIFVAFVQILAFSGNERPELSKSAALVSEKTSKAVDVLLPRMSELAVAATGALERVASTASASTVSAIGSGAGASAPGAGHAPAAQSGAPHAPDAVPRAKRAAAAASS